MYRILVKGPAMSPKYGMVWYDMVTVERQRVSQLDKSQLTLQIGVQLKNDQFSKMIDFGSSKQGSVRIQRLGVHQVCLFQINEKRRTSTYPLRICKPKIRQGPIDSPKSR